MAAKAQPLYILESYQLESQSDTTLLHYYFEEAYFPFLHRHGARNVSLFKSLPSEEVKELLVIYSLSSIRTLYNLQKAESRDQLYVKLAEPFFHPGDGELPFTAINRMLLQGLPGGIPSAPLPPYSGAPRDEIYEMRYYGAPTHRQLEEQVNMFSRGQEARIYEELGFKMTFFGRQITGPDLPALAYMLVFKDAEARESAWESFLSSKAWQTLELDPGYRDNVNRSRSVLYRAMSLGNH